MILRFVLSAFIASAGVALMGMGVLSGLDRPGVWTRTLAACVAGGVFAIAGAALMWVMP